MVDIKAHYSADGSLSERRLTSGPPTPLVGASAPTRNVHQTNHSTASVQTVISIKAQIYQAFSGLKSSLETLTGAAAKENDKIARPASNGAPGEISRSALTAYSVTRPQGASQIVVVRFAQYAQRATVLLPTAGPVKLSTGIMEQTLAVGPGNDTLMSLVQSLNGIPGLRAWLLQTRHGLALLVKSLPGTSNALQPASIETLWRLLQSALLSQSQPLVISFDEIPATDSWEGLTGLARDAGDGKAVDYRIAVIPQSHAHLHPKETIAALQLRVAALIREVNAIHTFLASIAKRGAGSGTDINPQDRIFAQVLLDRLRKITTRPVYGFASNPVFPADIGLEVGEDGLLTFNEACFNRMCEDRQDLLAAMVGPNADPDDIFLSPDIKVTDLLKQGVYKLIYDPTQTPVIATLDGFPLQRSHDPEGRPVLILGAQDQDLAIVLPKDSPMATELVYRLSLFDQLAAIAATTLSPDAPNLQSGTAHDVVVASAKRDDASVENMILGVLAQAVDQSDVAQPAESDAIPPQAAELLFYLLWIGLFVPRADRDRRKKQHPHRRPTPHGASIAFFGQAQWDQISKAKDDS